MISIIHAHDRECDMMFVYDDFSLHLHSFTLQSKWKLFMRAYMSDIYPPWMAEKFPYRRGNCLLNYLRKKKGEPMWS